MKFFKENYRVFVVFGIPLILLILVLLFNKNKYLKKEAIVPTLKTFNESVVTPQSSEVVKKSIQEVDGLIEIPDKSKVKVIEIVDIKSLQSKSPIFKKAYLHDLVILLPDKTIIFDPLTKTVRDVSSEVFYDKFAD